MAAAWGLKAVQPCLARPERSSCKIHGCVDVRPSAGQAMPVLAPSRTGKSTSVQSKDRAIRPQKLMGHSSNLKFAIPVDLQGMAADIDAHHCTTRRCNTGVLLDGRDTVLLQQRQRDRALQRSSLQSSLHQQGRKGEGSRCPGLPGMPTHGNTSELLAKVGVLYRLPKSWQKALSIAGGLLTALAAVAGLWAWSTGQTAGLQVTAFPARPSVVQPCFANEYNSLLLQRHVLAASCMPQASVQHPVLTNWTTQTSRPADQWTQLLICSAHTPFSRSAASCNVENAAPLRA